MRRNGFLQYRIMDDDDTQSGFNDDGEPIDSVESEWSDPIPCFIETNTHNERGKYEDGKFTQASYLAIVEKRDGFTSDTVRLTRGSKSLGEFAVQDIREVSLDRVTIQV